MHTINFARIRNAKALLLAPDKRVMHFPATNKVRIDNILSDVPEYRKADITSSRTGFVNADAASKLGVVPPVQNYRERGNIHTYTQDYAGKRLPENLEGISPKQQYKLGSQTARIQNKLLTKGLGHIDLHEGNIVRPNPKRKKVQLIDNDAIRNIKDDWDKSTMKSYYMPESFTAGYNNRRNFTQQKQMQHFANFALPLTGYGNALKNSWLSGVRGGAASGASLGSNIGAIAGITKGAGIGETEEEKANTTALGRTGKVLGGYLGGTAIGAGAGAVIGGGSRYVRGKLRPDPKQLTSSQPYNVQW
jgi:hypothetical protein